MSENYRFYAARMAARRRGGEGRLHAQLRELLEVVRWCEAVWALEVRIERSL